MYYVLRYKNNVVLQGPKQDFGPKRDAHAYVVISAAHRTTLYTAMYCVIYCVMYCVPVYWVSILEAYFPVGICPGREISGRDLSRSGNIRSGYIRSGNIEIGKCQSGNIRSGNVDREMSATHYRSARFVCTAQPFNALTVREVNSLASRFAQGCW